MLAVIVAGLLLVGCATRPVSPNATEAEGGMFRPTAMRLHPVFTQTRNWSGGERPEGVEAVVEFQDQFGEPTRASGQVLFELFEYRKGYPDPRGRRVVNPWVASVDSVAAQRVHWNRTGRAYSFQLSYPQINPKATYVLTATFELTGGGRFFDRMILEPPQAEPEASQPATSPAHEPGVRKSEP